MSIEIIIASTAALILISIAVVIVKIRKRNPHKHMIRVIEKKYEDTWGMDSALNILGIHSLAEFKDNKRYIYLVFMFRNGILVHSFSEVKLRGRNIIHKKMNLLEKEKFLNSNPNFKNKYFKLISIYENH